MLPSGHHYRLSIYRGHIQHDCAHNPIMTLAKRRPNFALTNDTLYLALTGELWVSFVSYSKNIYIYIYIYRDRTVWRPLSWSPIFKLSLCNSFKDWTPFSYMMTSSNINIFALLGPLWEESTTSHRWIPPQRPVPRKFDVFFDLRLNKRLNKHSWRRWFETS